MAVSGGKSHDEIRGAIVKRPGILIRKTLEHQSSDRLPRGELWLGTELIRSQGLEDNLEGHLTLRNRLGMDLLTLPLTDDRSLKASHDYRYFTLDELKEAMRMSDLFVGVVIDGPFQRLVGKKGLMSVINEWIREKQAIVQEYMEEAAKVQALISQCLKLKVGMVVIADDIAYTKSTYFSPEDSKGLLIPFYSQAVDRIHSEGVYALFHSCGNISGLLPHLIACGLDGFAACESHILDLISLKKEHGSQLTFMAGIEAELLQGKSLTESRKKYFTDLVSTLAQGGGFILCSSCGLYSRGFTERLLNLYQLAEQSLPKQ